MYPTCDQGEGIYCQKDGVWYRHGHCWNSEICISLKWKFHYLKNKVIFQRVTADSFQRGLTKFPCLPRLPQLLSRWWGSWKPHGLLTWPRNPSNAWLHLTQTVFFHRDLATSTCTRKFAWMSSYISLSTILTIQVKSPWASASVHSFPFCFGVALPSPLLSSLPPGLFTNFTGWFHKTNGSTYLIQS